MPQLKLHAPLAARVVQLEPALVLEAMKMEHVVPLPPGTRVAEWRVGVDEMVEEGALLRVAPGYGGELRRARVGVQVAQEVAVVVADGAQSEPLEKGRHAEPAANQSSGRMPIATDSRPGVDARSASVPPHDLFQSPGANARR